MGSNHVIRQLSHKLFSDRLYIILFAIDHDYRSSFDSLKFGERQGKSDGAITSFETLCIKFDFTCDGHVSRINRNVINRSATDL